LVEDIGPEFQNEDGGKGFNQGYAPPPVKPELATSGSPMLLF